jgi:hypothetical protein
VRVGSRRGSMCFGLFMVALGMLENVREKFWEMSLKKQRNQKCPVKR